MILADLIKRAYKYRGVITAYIYGDFGVGKTSYALWTAYTILEDWDRVLDHLFFKPEDACTVMKRAITSGRRLKIIVMDDAGLWLGRLMWWEEDKVAFMNFFNLIRSVAGGVLFTTPSQELPKQILRKCSLRVNVRHIGREDILQILGEEGLRELEAKAKEFGLDSIFSMAIGYRLRTLPTFLELVKKEFYDFFPLHYPNAVLEKYEKMRRKALEYYFARWEETVKAKKGPKEGRVKLFLKAKEMLEKGENPRYIIRLLKEEGIPYPTARRWVEKIRRELGSKGDPQL